MIIKIITASILGALIIAAIHLIYVVTFYNDPYCVGFEIYRRPYDKNIHYRQGVCYNYDKRKKEFQRNDLSFTVWNSGEDTRP